MSAVGARNWPSGKHPVLADVSIEQWSRGEHAGCLASVRPYSSIARRAENLLGQLRWPVNDRHLNPRWEAAAEPRRQRAKPATSTADSRTSAGRRTPKPPGLVLPIGFNAGLTFDSRPPRMSPAPPHQALTTHEERTGSREPWQSSQKRFRAPTATSAPARKRRLWRKNRRVNPDGNV